MPTPVPGYGPTDVSVGGQGGPGTGSTAVGGFDFSFDPGGGFGKDKKKKRRNLRFEYMAMVQGMGIAMTPNIQQLINEAIKKGYSATVFQHFLSKTPEYKQRFAGKPPWMSEAQYLADERAYESIAALAGVNLPQSAVKSMFKDGITPEVFQMKAEAVGRLKRNKTLFQQFSKEAAQAFGKAPSRTELLKFALGTGNQKWYDLWQDAVTRTAAVEAGVRVKRQAGKQGPYSSIGQGLIEKISGKGLSEEEMRAGFQDLADHLLTTMPLSRMQGYGLSKKDLVSAVFGGKNQGAVRQKMLRVAQQEEAFYVDRAAPELEAARGEETRGVRTRQRAQTL